MEYPEPIFQMPGMSNPAVLEVVELVERNLDGLSSRRHSEDFSRMSSNDARAHSRTAGGPNNFVNDNFHVGKGFEEAGNQIFEPLRSGSLSGECGMSCQSGVDASSSKSGFLSVNAR